MKRLCSMIVLCGACLVAGRAELIYRDYSSSPKTAATALSSDTGSESAYLYIATNGVAGWSNPPGSEVYLLAYRYRGSRGLFPPFNIEEYVSVEGSTTEGFHLSYLDGGTLIDGNLGYGGGNLLYRFDASNPGNTYSDCGPGYLGFRIRVAAGSYLYGWARVEGFIKTENAGYDLNQASVSITAVGIMDVPNVFIEAGQTYIPTPGMQVLGTNGAVVVNDNTPTLADGTAFEATRVGGERLHTFGITNNGTGVLLLEVPVVTDGAELSVTGMPTTVEVGAVSNFGVVFSPTSHTEYTATLIVSNNTAQGPYAVNLSGAGYTIDPDNGPLSGGNLVAVSNSALGMVTNVLVGGFQVAPSAAVDGGFTFAMPPGMAAGAVDIMAQSLTGDTVLPAAYTYNSRGRIFRRVPDWGDWTQMPSMPLYARQNGAAVLGDSIYVVAGSISSGPTTNVWRFDGSQWSYTRGLPDAHQTIYHAVATFQDRVYCCGGYVVSNGAGAYSQEVWAYDGTNWSREANLPDTVNKGRAVVYSNRLVVTRGYAGNEVYAYDGTNWTELAPLPHRRVYPGMSVLDGSLYVVGGSDTGSPGVNQTNVYRFDGVGWSQTAGMPAAMNTPSAATLDGHLYTLGQTNSAYPALYRFDGVSWAVAPTNLPVVRQEQSLLRYDQSLWMVAGNGYPPTDTETYRYQPGFLDVSGVTPSQGSITGGYAVIIAGTNLCSEGDVTNVTLHDVSVESIVSQCPTQLVVVAGHGTAADIGVGDVHVFSVAIGDTAATDAFEYIPEQWIFDFLPTNGCHFLASDVVGLSAYAFSELPVSFSIGAGPGGLSEGTNLSFSTYGQVSVVASQPGDATWPAAASLTNTYTVHALPVVGPVTVWRATNNLNLKIPDVQLLTNAVCPEGSTLSVVWSAPQSTNSGSVAVEGRWTTYEPPAGDNSPDYFTFLVRNGFGGEAYGQAEILVFVPEPGPTRNISAVTLTDSNTMVRFVGVPGRTYQVQMNTNLVSGSWVPVGQVTIGGVGDVIFTNTGPPPDTQYFRTIQPSP